MNTVRRRLIRIRGSYALYLPKVSLARYGDVSDVEVLWDHNSLVVAVPTRKRAATRWSERADKVVVGAYAAGLDELVLLAGRRRLLRFVGGSDHYVDRYYQYCQSRDQHLRVHGAPGRSAFKL
ncbi:conserved hypothetical protein [Thermoproteus tenax Kra 1]|uniref:Uncharacterized protein n=1 Tax=Thermoproteus tenax (strain ATCC 35583 / DSM 2078 / JCM 9277 / NBRC 100435 / Kra 1) TaxID=768679 RepID=G4RKB5_THETK|nr:conserved hypothetical protein [Thermoproteus tenax Kra 1]